MASTGNSTVVTRRQIDRIFDVLKDGKWHTLASIAAATQDRKKSIASRIRDLRLPEYGGHTIDARQQSGSAQVWEYRLVPKKVPNPRIGVTGIQGHRAVKPMMGVTAVMGTTGLGLPAGYTPYSAPVRFVNVNTMKSEYIARSKCKKVDCGPYERVVAMDDNGTVIEHLVTTLSDL